ncbi:hypothetical protein ACYOEI_00175 [Singulisphaera rosea]
MFPFKSMPWKKPESPAEAIHSTPGSMTLSEMRDRLLCYDSLVSGPCHPDPDTHGELRSQYWSSEREPRGDIPDRRRRSELKQAQEAEEVKIHAADQWALTLELFPASQPVVLWNSPAIGDRLTFWWCLDAIQTHGIDRRRFWVADVTPRLIYGERVTAQADWVLRMTFRAIEPLGRRRLQRGASLWRRFADASPEALEHFRRRASADDSDKAVITKLYQWGLPRVFRTAPSIRRLSEFDELLLASLTEDEWVRPVDIVLKCEKDPALTILNRRYGDRLFAYRLHQWAMHRPEVPALDREFDPYAPNRGMEFAYTLTERGRRLLETGFEDAEDVPPFLHRRSPGLFGTAELGPIHRRRVLARREMAGMTSRNVPSHLAGLASPRFLTQSPRDERDALREA